MTTPSQLPHRDNDGTRPCIPPHVLAELLRRIAAKGRGQCAEDDAPVDRLKGAIV